jgi:hypothetical protein
MYRQLSDVVAQNDLKSEGFLHCAIVTRACDVVVFLMLQLREPISYPPCYLFPLEHRVVDSHSRLKPYPETNVLKQ